VRFDEVSELRQKCAKLEEGIRKTKKGNRDSKLHMRLRATHRLEKDRKRADRIKTIILLNKGMTIFTSRKSSCLIKPQSDDMKNKRKGVDGLLEGHYHGSAGLLNERTGN
jgi:hypothetical protein